MSQMTGGGNAPKIKIKLPVKIKQQPSATASLDASAAAGSTATGGPGGGAGGAPPGAPQPMVSAFSSAATHGAGPTQSQSQSHSQQQQVPRIKLRGVPLRPAASQQGGQPPLPAAAAADGQAQAWPSMGLGFDGMGSFPAPQQLADLPPGLQAVPLGAVPLEPSLLAAGSDPAAAAAAAAAMGGAPLPLLDLPGGLVAIPLAPEDAAAAAAAPPSPAPVKAKKKAAAGGGGGGGGSKRRPRAGSDPDFEDEAAAWGGDDLEDEDFVLDMALSDSDFGDDLPFDSEDSDGRPRRRGRRGKAAGRRAAAAAAGGGGTAAAAGRRSGRRGGGAAAGNDDAWGGPPGGGGAGSPRALRPQRCARAAAARGGDEYVNPLDLDFEALDREAEAAAAEAAAKPKAPKQPRAPKPKPPPPAPAADGGGGGADGAAGAVSEQQAGGAGPAPERKRSVRVVGPDDGDYAPSEDEGGGDFDIAMDDNEDDEDFDIVVEEELTGSRRGRRPGSGIPRVRGRGRGRGRGASAAAAAASEGTAGGGATVSSGGGRSRRSRRVAARSRSGADGGGGGSYMTGGGSGGWSDEDWSEAEEDEEDEEAGGGELFGDKSAGDFRDLTLKPDHANRPLWVCPDGRIFLETFSPIYKQAYDFLIAVAEPVCRPESVHEYVLTPHSLYAAVSVGLETGTIIKTLNTLSKVAVSAETARFIRRATQNYGKAKMVLKRNKFWVESAHKEVLDRLLADSVIADARTNSLGLPGDGLVRSKALRERAAHSLAAATQAAIKEQQELAAKLEAAKAVPSREALKFESKMEPPPTAGNPQQQQQQYKGDGEEEDVSDPEDFSGVRKKAADGSAAAAAAGGGGGTEPPLAGPLSAVGQGLDAGLGAADGGDEGAPEEDPGREVLAFEVLPDKVEAVKKQCLPPPEGRLNYPLLEEYDFRADAVNPTLPMELKPHVSLRPYQEKSLSKMFGNGRARSGIIVLPCGAGKSLVGVAATARVKKSCLCLCTSSVSVDQWRHQFKLWSNLQDHQIIRFTSEGKEGMPESKDTPVVAISTFTMISHSGKRSEAGEAMMRAIREREWGLLLLDEVHVVPAAMFRKVIGIVKAHCKLGLTATLVREDERIGDLNFLIGPKLYEANWLDLTREGHIANVQCVEVWCPMAAEYMRAYLQLSDQADEAGGGGSYLGSPASKRQLLYAMNPNKFFACQFLVWFHETHRNDKIIVFSDNIFALRKYAILMRRPFIYGGTSHQERTRVLHRFKTSTDLNTVFLSKVGDNSLDIPEANVLIQISSHAGSRRQEAQRLGRILRAKKGAAPPAPGEFDAYFYTLVSRDTQEMFYSAKRQQFLIDQGYAFKVVEFLHDTARQSDGVDGFRLVGATVDEQRNMLSTIMEQGASAEGIGEVLEEDEDRDDLVAHQTHRRVTGVTGGGAARRAAGSLAAASGAHLGRYNAFGRGGGRGGRGGQKRPLTQAELERRDKSKKMRSRLAG